MVYSEENLNKVKKVLELCPIHKKVLLISQKLLRPPDLFHITVFIFCMYSHRQKYWTLCNYVRKCSISPSFCNKDKTTTTNRIEKTKSQRGEAWSLQRSAMNRLRTWETKLLKSTVSLRATGPSPNVSTHLLLSPQCAKSSRKMVWMVIKEARSTSNEFQTFSTRISLEKQNISDIIAEMPMFLFMTVSLISTFLWF